MLRARPPRSAIPTPSALPSRWPLPARSTFGSNFQRRYGGLVRGHGFNRLEWGIVHGRPHPLSNFAPDQIDASTEGGGDVVACCSGITRRTTGGSTRAATLHWCFPPARSASSFEMHVEREALWWEIGRTSGKLRAIDLVADEGARETLLANLRHITSCRVSDACVSVYWNEGVVAVRSGPRSFAFM